MCHVSNRRLVGPVVLLVSATASYVTGCAGKTQSAKLPPQVAPLSFSVPGNGGRLVVLPADAMPFPESTGVLNAVLTSAKFNNVSEAVLAKVSMEVAQLSLECVEPADPCYQSVGRFLTADRILWADVKSRNGPDGKAHPTVIIRMFDVEAGRSLGEAQQSYATSPTAQDMEVLLRKTLASPTGSAGRQ